MERQRIINALNEKPTCMANISSENGTLTLKGDWTEAAVEALKPVLDAWKFYGEYGMRVYEYPYSRQNNNRV